MDNKKIDRRRMLTRLGLVAGAVYVAPALTSLGMARASGRSGGSGATGASKPSPASKPSRADVSRPSRAHGNGKNQAGNLQAPPWMLRMFGG